MHNGGRPRPSVCHWGPPPSFYGDSMTEREELEYLIGLVQESTAWTRQEGDKPALELEVNDRIKNLLEQVTAPAKPARSRPDRPAGQAKTMAISIKGKKHRFPLDHLEKVPFKGSPTGYRWQLRKEFEHEYAAKI